MKKIGIIFRKELKDTLRDRRTLFFMIVFPILIIPLIIGGLPKIMISMMEKKMTERITIAVIGERESPELMEMFRKLNFLKKIINQLKRLKRVELLMSMLVMVSKLIVGKVLVVKEQNVWLLKILLKV